MATINRAPFNALIDDDGSNSLGTVWNKNQIKVVILDPVDAALTTGLLSITGFGTHSISGAGAGDQILQLVNTQAGAQNSATLFLGNDLAAARLRLHALASNYTPSGIYVADGAVLNQTGAGGLSIAASHSSGMIRFATGGQVEQWRITPEGWFQSGTYATGSLFAQLLGGRVALGNPGVASTMVAGFYNANGLIGTITTENSTCLYNSASDVRLKRDLGVASDLAALRAVVVHDFEWLAGGGRDRGVFAQETAPVFPRAVTVGTDGADLSRPWMTNYPAFVPDLIVGWQQHTATIAALEARVAAQDARIAALEARLTALAERA
jgi:hypothetical protein